MHVCKGGQISEVGAKFPRKYGPRGAKFPRKFGPGGPNFRGGQISCDTGLARLTGLTQFFRLLWGLKYSEELKLKGIAALSNTKACHRAK